MWPFYLLGLLVACLIGWLATWLVQGGGSSNWSGLTRIQVEETLVSTLHGLGAALPKPSGRPITDWIVEGAARILMRMAGRLHDRAQRDEARAHVYFQWLSIAD
jgi:hypothetical protein